MSSLVLLSKQENNASGTSALPVELWSKISWEATMIPTKNEFGTDPRAYIETFCDPPVPSSKITVEELKVALKSRLNIVLVCKHWRDIGLPILYSHFRIPAKVDDTTYQTIHQTLAGDSWLTNSVRRVTVVVDSSLPADAAEAKQLLETNGGVVSILTLLTRLQIVSASPILFWLMPLSSRTSLAVADCTMLKVTYPDNTSRLDGWEHLVHLALHFPVLRAHEYHEDTLSLLFPSLIYLDIAIGLTMHNKLITAISNTWHAPKLDAFWIYSEEWTPWLPFFAKHASTLTKLSIRNFTHQSPIHLPNLRQLFLEGGSTRYQPRTLVDAPHLERVVVSQPRYLQDISVQLDFISRTLMLWETAEPIRTYCLSVEDFIFPIILSKPTFAIRVNTLRSRGSKVEFYLDEGGCHIFEPLNV